MRYKLLGGLAVRRACYGVLRFVMESGACIVLLPAMAEQIWEWSSKCCDAQLACG